MLGSPLFETFRSIAVSWAPDRTGAAFCFAFVATLTPGRGPAWVKLEWVSLIALSV
jgi:hypothetical protein